MRVSTGTTLSLLSAALFFLGTCSTYSTEEEAQVELRRRGIEPNRGSFNKAIREGDTESVDLLLRAGVRSRRGLRLAAKEGQCDILRRLVAVDYRVDGILAAEALAWARFNEHHDCVESLEAVGADLRAPSRQGDSALTKAAREGNLPFLKVLISVGLDPDEPNRNGKPPLIEAVEGGQQNSIRELLKNRADVNATDLDGWSALTYAAWLGRVRLARQLVDAGADVDLETNTGWTALTFAALKGHGAVLQTLLAAGANPNAASESGLTPLMRAAYRGDIQMVQALLQAGADRSLRIDGVDAAWWAEVGGHQTVARLLTSDSSVGKERS